MSEDDLEFEFNSYEELKSSSSSKDIFNEILHSYLDLIEEYKQLCDKIDICINDTKDNKNSIEKNVEDIREKIIKIARIAYAKSDKNHTHDEFDIYEQKLEELYDLTTELNDEFENIKNDISDIDKELNKEIQKIDSLIEENKKFNNKLNILANNYLQLRKKFDSYQKLQSLKNEALFKSVKKGKCEGCDEIIDINSLNTAKCPSCKMNLDYIEEKLLFTSIIHSN